MGVIGKQRRKEQRERNRHAGTVRRIEALQGALAERKVKLAAKSARAVAGLLDAAAGVLEPAVAEYVGREPLDIPERVDSPDAPVTLELRAPGGVVVRRTYRRDQLDGGFRVSITPQGVSAVPLGHGETGRGGKG